MLKHISMIPIIVLVVGLSGGSSAYASSAAQQNTNPLTLDVRVGFDGYVQSGAWVPVTVVASNTGADVSGELRIQVDALTGGRTFYTYPIDLPRGSHKQVTFYPADIVTLNNVAQVDLIGGNRVVASQQVRVNIVEQTALLIGLWSDTPQALAGLGKVKPTSGKVSVATLTEDDLPPVAEGWAALDVLVIYDADTGKLSPEQQTAMRNWVEAGGRLIVAGGASFQRTLIGLGDLTPLNATSTANVSVEGLSTAVGEPFKPQVSMDALVSVGSLANDARILYSDAQVPLVAWRPMGYGRVDFLAADPGLDPLLSWQAMPDLWKLILANGGVRPGWAYGFSSDWEAARQAVVAIPGVSLPSVLQLCGFLVVYIVLIGPVNYLVLWRLKRRELAWVTIPALVILFSGIAYLTGFQLRGSQVILHRLAVVQSWEGSDTARVGALLGVWSPRRTGYDIEIEPGYLARPLPRDLGGMLTSATDTVIEGGQTTMLRRVQVDVGSVQPFIIEGTTSNVPHIESNLTVSLSDRGLRLVGDVINAGDVPMTHVRLVLAGGVNALNDLPAGGVLPVDMLFSGGQATQSLGSGLDPYPASYGGYFYDPFGLGGSFAAQIADTDTCYGYGMSQDDGTQRCRLISSVLTNNGCGEDIYLIGWSDKVPLQVNVLNASFDEMDLVLHIVKLNVKLAEGSQVLDTIPPGLMTWQLIEDPGGYHSATPYELYLDPAETFAFRFQPVSLVPVSEIKSLVIHLEGENGSAVPQVEIWNFSAGNWETLQVNWGDTRIENAVSYVDASGGVNLRIRTGADYGGYISRFDVTLLSK
ncbi:MAG: hypothetical protein JXB07_17430 [Anaerolineae bacterium]|nr:hypothetical protein [Anaerolineae bacterium]